MALPTIVIVPGACQTPAHYQPFASALQHASFQVAVVPLPSLGGSRGWKDFSEDVTAIRKVVSNLVDDGTEVVVLMHSYGGMPGSAALRGLGVKDRAKGGMKGGVKRLVHVASHALREGEGMPSKGDLKTMRSYGESFNEEVCVFNMMLEMTDWQIDIIKAGTVAISKDAALYALFHEIPASEGEHWASLLEPHSVGAMWSEQTYAAFMDIPSTYVVCELDRVVPMEQQESMIRNAKEVEPSAFDVVERLQSGHEPFYSEVKTLVSVVERAARE